MFRTGMAGLLMGCAFVVAACGGGAPAARSREEAGPPASAALVRCDGRGVHVVTPVVRAQADGIHVRVDNRRGQEVRFNYEIDHGDGGGGGALVGPGVSDHVVPFAARTLGVTCTPPEDTTLEYALDYEEIAIAEPRRAKSHELTCATRAPNREEPRLTGRDPVHAARSYLQENALRRGDVVEQAISPGPEFPIVRVVRRGKVVAALWFASEPPGGETVVLDDIEACSTFYAADR